MQCGPSAEVGNGVAERGLGKVMLKETSFLLQEVVSGATERAFKSRAVFELDSEMEFRESIGERCS